jgi:hypothetical protein
MAELFRGFLFLFEEFPQIGKIDGGALTSIEGISIDMKDFLA